MATAKAMPAESPAPFYVFDVETMNPPADVVERMEKEFLETWEAPGNLRDPDKVEAKRTTDFEKFREKLALTDEAPVTMVGLMFEDQTFLLHGLRVAKAKWAGSRKNNVTLEGFRGERALMEAVVTVLNEKTSPGWVGVGHNAYKFDLPKLRLACVRQGLALPDALRVVVSDDEDRRRFVDTMQHFCRYFGRNGELFISQDKMLQRLGLPSLLDGIADGKDVPGLLANGEIAAVANKLLADLVGVKAAYLRMVGVGT